MTNGFFARDPREFVTIYDADVSALWDRDSAACPPPADPRPAPGPGPVPGEATEAECLARVVCDRHWRVARPRPAKNRTQSAPMPWALSPWVGRVAAAALAFLTAAIAAETFTRGH